MEQMSVQSFTPWSSVELQSVTPTQTVTLVTKKIIHFAVKPQTVTQITHFVTGVTICIGGNTFQFYRADVCTK